MLNMSSGRKPDDRSIVATTVSLTMTARHLSPALAILMLLALPARAQDALVIFKLLSPDLALELAGRFPL